MLKQNIINILGNSTNKKLFELKILINQFDNFSKYPLSTDSLTILHPYLIP